MFEFCSNELTTFNVKQWSIKYWKIKAVVSLIFSISRLLWTFYIAGKVGVGQFCRVLNELPYVLGVTYSLGFKPLAFFFPHVLQPNKKILSTVSSHKSVVWCDNGNQTLTKLEWMLAINYQKSVKYLSLLFWITMYNAKMKLNFSNLETTTSTIWSVVHSHIYSLGGRREGVPIKSIFI